MTEKRLNYILGAIFLVVGILATINTFRLHTYINQTLPRDQAQEQCNTDTIDVLKSWVQERIKRDDTMNARDDAAVGCWTNSLPVSSPARPISEPGVTPWPPTARCDRTPP